MSSDRRDLFADVRRVVIKLGSAVLSRPDGRLDRALIASLAEQVATLRSRSIDVLIVSSGAVSAGLGEMGRNERPASVTEKQALAAIGQGRLMQIYSDAFAVHELHVAQVLLSRSDLDDRQRYLNARGALLTLLEMGIVPIINENDTTAIDELTFGDNDILAAAVAAKVEADLLIFLTVVEGLTTREGEILPRVERVTDEIIALVRDERTSLGRGGMESKLLAAKSAATSGVPTVITSGKAQRPVERLFAGEALGTLFDAAERRLAGRKTWIAMGKAHHNHAVTVDAGAVRALCEQGKSLLPIGVTGVRGDFERGDVVEIHGPGGEVVGRGLVNYAAEAVRRIGGARSDEIADRLGLDAAPADEVVHRDNLIVYH